MKLAIFCVDKIPSIDDNLTEFVLEDLIDASNLKTTRIVCSNSDSEYHSMLSAFKAKNPNLFVYEIDIKKE